MLLLTNNTGQETGGLQKTMVIRDACPRCQSSKYTKNGHIHNGKQNYQCQDCGCQFVACCEQSLIADDTRALIERLLVERDFIARYLSCGGSQSQVALRFLGP